ncbi:hypothetical protein FMM01_02035 [Schleiferilactobacillus harbinensis]|uniref:hypothetical protein n=1 Tax=Schleiferilactobacillus harbinensis TaxID=304207 RepID=UPI00123BC983|nr:hypothetical protein [Schleiferilactobacillus harbinensis]QEU46194.1 hypothetical protein FMM01_02035 [Schleiferilactobacillus harbinensis]
MSERPDITKALSELVVKRLNANNMYWSAEVNFDKNTQHNKRIDFVGFKPFTPDYVVEPASVELGTFACYEVKSSLADFRSGNGLTFYGDENYLVCLPELVEQLRATGDLTTLHVDAVLCPDKAWKRLYAKVDAPSGQHGRDSHRRRTASEMLWAIVQSHGSRAGQWTPATIIRGNEHA